MCFNKQQRKVIFARANACCEHCGAKWSDGVMLEVDHVLPICEGGKDEVSNGQLLCRPCHAKKHEQLAREAQQRGDRISEGNHSRATASIRGKPKNRWGF